MPFEDASADPCPVAPRVVPPVAATPLSFDDVYAEHGASVWRFLRALRVSEHDLDDALQEVFMVVHRRLDAFDGRHAVSTWLYAICLRTALSHRRRARSRREDVTDAPPDVAVAATQPEAFARHQARALLQRALDDLDDDKRAVFVLFEIEELPMTEVAVVVGCPLQTAYSRLHAARRHVDAAVRRLQAAGTGP